MRFDQTRLTELFHWLQSCERWRVCQGRSGWHLKDLCNHRQSPTDSWQVLWMSHRPAGPAQSMSLCTSTPALHRYIHTHTSVVGPSPSQVRRSGTHYRTVFVTRRSAAIVSDNCWRRNYFGITTEYTQRSRNASWLCAIQIHDWHWHWHTHTSEFGRCTDTQASLTTILPGEPGLASSPLTLPSRWTWVSKFTLDSPF